MRTRIKAGLAVCAILLLAWAFHDAGPALVVNAPARSQVILVLAGDINDQRYWKALELLRAGYAERVLVDASSDAVTYGRTPAQMAADFVKRTAGNLAVQVCPITGDSTVLEMASVSHCLPASLPRSILIVTSDFHSRRALSIARKMGPGVTWSVAAADSGLLSSPRWWRDREVAKFVFLEWQKLFWWELVDRHRSLPGTRLSEGG